MTTNQELLSELTRATMTPIFIRQIERGDHDFQLVEIFQSDVPEPIKRACVHRAASFRQTTG